jgi:formate/nitrite transporter
VPNNYNTPTEVVNITIDVGVAKATNSFAKLFLLGILAGAFIAFGASASSVAMHDISNVGIARLVAGCIFPVGLIMIVVVGGELFTGNCLMVEALCDKKITVLRWARNLSIVFISNLVGSLIVVLLITLAAQLNYTDGTLGAFTIKVASGKVGLSFLTAFTSGILCNVLVCVAVLAAFAARDIVGKVVAIFFPIMAFVLSGFEHCVANMYYIPAGILAAQNPAYATKATELYGITADKLDALNPLSFLLNNLVPVSLGNIVGGVVVGLAVYFCFRARRAESA